MQIGVLDVPKSLVVNNKGSEATDCRDYRLGNHSTYNLNINTSYVATYANWLKYMISGMLNIDGFHVQDTLLVFTQIPMM
jgi:hypothetical protein